MELTVNKILNAVVQNGKNAGSEYIKVSLSDAKAYNIFEPAMKKVFLDAFEHELPVEVNIEKQGNFSNITSAIISRKEPAQTPKTEPKPPVKPAEALPEAIKPKASTESRINENMTKDDWAERDRTTRKSIERQKSLELAVEVSKFYTPDDQTAEKAITIAAKFEDYIEFGVRGLAAEAKKLGVTEIPKGSK